MEYISDWKIISYDELGSTNDKAYDFSSSLEYEKFIIVAKNQTAGRGRRGRTWQSLDGNLFMSQAFSMDLRYLNDTVFLVSLSLLEAIKSFSSDIKIQLKWPNDVLIKNRKVSGILLEKGENGYIIVGIGVNVKASPQDKDLIYPACSLRDCEIFVDCKELLEAYVKAFDRNFAFWQKQGFVALRDKWLKYAIGLQQDILVNLENSQEEGGFIGVDERGALLLQQKDKVKPILAGDVFIKKENNFND